MISVIQVTVNLSSVSSATFSFFEDVSHLIQDASSVLTNWRGGSLVHIISLSLQGDQHFRWHLYIKCNRYELLYWFISLRGLNETVSFCSIFPFFAHFLWPHFTPIRWYEQKYSLSPTRQFLTTLSVHFNRTLLAVFMSGYTSIHSLWVKKAAKDTSDDGIKCYVRSRQDTSRLPLAQYAFINKDSARCWLMWR